MNNPTEKQKISDDQISNAKSVDVAQLAAGYTELRKHSTGELCGPCPKCGGDDRFVVSAEWFLCRNRQNAKKGDAIEFIQWVDNCGFREAVAKLTGDTLPKGLRIVKPTKSEKSRISSGYDYRSDKWQTKAESKLLSFANALQSDLAAQPGRDYLKGRGLDPLTWSTYELGFNPSVTLPNHPDKIKVPAIAIPWRVGGKLRGIRYRLLKVHTYSDDKDKAHEVKQSAEFGSRFGGALYGSHAFDAGLGSYPALGTLILVEGEINASSCWQVSHGSRVGVLSMGSESARLTQAMTDRISQYGRVIVWCDREDVSLKIGEQIEQAHLIKSPNNLDANDLLQSGQLGAFLAGVRLRACENDCQRKALHWDLWDAAKDRKDGIDSGTADIVRSIAHNLGLSDELCETENGCWIVKT